VPYILGRATLLACACLAGLLISAHARAETLRIGGTGSASALLSMLGAAFAAESEIHIEVKWSLGSNGALRALTDDALDLAVVGRRLKPQETSAGLSALLSLRAPFVLATSQAQADAMTVAEIAEAFLSERATWRDGTLIRPILRPLSETDTALIVELFPSVAGAIEAARRRADVPVAATDQDNADAGEHTPGSLITTTLTQIMLEKRRLRLVAIDGVEPTIENFERGVYAHAKPLYVVAPPRPSSAAERFVDFLRSPVGRELLRGAGVL
jgi:phosphate transport system substrate-binding protein